jgi:hypothetical protein
LKNLYLDFVFTGMPISCKLLGKPKRILFKLERKNL